MNINRNYILSFICLCLVFPTGAFGQYLQKSEILPVKGTSSTTDTKVKYPIIYSEGIAGSAIWGLGVKMTDGEGRTIRHTVLQGNGENMNVNSKVPVRFIVAPADLSSTMTWANAEGTVDNDNSNNNGTFSGTANSGCKNYKVNGDPNRKWRLPTQRELLLMWFFREPIGIVCQNAGGSGMQGVTGVGSATYWSATEENSNYAWGVTFGGMINIPLIGQQLPASVGCNAFLKSDIYRVRCVSDY